jgi:hypothetical protein
VRAVLDILSEIIFDPTRLPKGVRPVSPDEDRVEAGTQRLTP